MRAVPSERESVSDWLADHAKSAQSAIAARFNRAKSSSEPRTAWWETSAGQVAEGSGSVP